MVFVSYSHRDEEWKDRLLRHLAVGLDRDSLEVWDDTRIPAGSDWQKELERAIAKAEVAVLLVSADYLASDFVRRSELPALLQRARNGDLHLLPVIARPCAWRTVGWMGQLQALPHGGVAISAGDDSEIEARLAEVAERVFDLLGGVEGDSSELQPEIRTG